MKLRIKADTIRLRLTQDEVSMLVNEGSVLERCIMGGADLVYGIHKNSGDTLKARFHQNKIEVYIPEDWLVDWDKNDTVGFDGTMENGPYILVEKDFKCLIPRDGEDEENMYPNPQS